LGCLPSPDHQGVFSMSLTGKILAFLNVLGVAGFLCLAAMDFGKQQAWKYANFLHDRVTFGLPLDDKETGPQSEILVEQLSDATLQQLFPQGEKVKTQLEEVARVRRVLEGALKAEADKKKQLTLSARSLLPLAESNTEREKLISVRQNLLDEKKIDALKEILKDGIKQALEIVKPDPKKRSFEEGYYEAVRLKPGDPKDPFVAAMLRVMFREGGKKAEDAPLDNAEAFLQAVRNEPGKSFDDIVNAMFDEALESIRVEQQQRLDEHFAQAAEGKRRVKDQAGKAYVGKELLSTTQHKRMVAHLLFNLVEVLPAPAGAPPQSGTLWDNPAYRRVINVVGVQMMGKEV